jgi:hypothetical protein
MSEEDIRDLVKTKKEQISSRKSSLNEYLKSSLETILKDCVKKTLEHNQLKFVMFTLDYTLVKGIDEVGYAMNHEIYIYNKEGNLSPNRIKESYVKSTGDDTLSIDNFDSNKISSILNNLVNQSGGKMQRMKGFVNDYGEFVYYQPHKDYQNYVCYLKKAPEGWVSKTKTYSEPYSPKAFQLISLDLCHEHRTPVLRMFNDYQYDHEDHENSTSGERMQVIRFETPKPELYFTQAAFTPTSSYGAPRVHFVDIFFIDYSL